MLETNPYTNRPFGTEEEYNRCTPAGTRHPIREYNGMARAWCADQATHPGETRIFGPYASASWFRWLLTIGRAVFDRKTGELIACTHIDLALPQANKLLQDVSKDMPSEIVLTKPDGTVVVGAAKNIPFSTKIWETDYIDEETCRDLTHDIADRRSCENNGKHYNLFPLPIPPDEDDPLYKPVFYVVGSIDAEV